MLNDFEAGFNWVSKSIEVYWRGFDDSYIDT